MIEFVSYLLPFNEMCLHSVIGLVEHERLTSTIRLVYIVSRGQTLPITPIINP